MTILKIVSRWDSSEVLFSGEANSLRDLVIKAVASRAYLSGADLSGAYLSGADLSRAYLSGADLSGADLSGADLSRAYLSRAKTAHSWLDPIRADVWRILDEAPGEVAGLLAAVREGRIDGSAYRGECACLVGTIANVRKVDVDKCGISLNSDCPAERFFVRLTPGQTPDNSSDAAIVEGWILRWMAERPATVAPRKPAAKKRAARKAAAR